MLNNLCCMYSAVWHDTSTAVVPFAPDWYILMFYFCLELLHWWHTFHCCAWSLKGGYLKNVNLLHSHLHFVLFLYSVHRYKRVITYHPTIWCHLQEEGFPFHSVIVYWEIICATIAPGLLIRNLNFHLDFCKDTQWQFLLVTNRRRWKG